MMPRHIFIVQFPRISFLLKVFKTVGVLKFLKSRVIIIALYLKFNSYDQVEMILQALEYETGICL